MCVHARLCLILCKPMGCNPPGSSSCWISQWDLPAPGIEPISPTLQVDSLPPEPPVKPINKQKPQLNSQGAVGGSPTFCDHNKVHEEERFLS